jgi:hypothetical protein
VSLSVLGTDSWSDTGNHTRALTIPAGTKAIVIAEVGTFVPESDTFTVSLGGLSFTRHNGYTGEDLERVWDLLDIEGRANDTLTVTDTNGNANEWRLLYVRGHEVAFLDAQVDNSFVAADSPRLRTHVAPGNGGNLLGIIAAHKHSTFGGDVTIHAPATSLYHGSVALNDCLGYYLESDPDTNLVIGVDVAGTNSFQTGLLTVAYYEADPVITFEPVPIGAEAGFQAGVAFEVGADVLIPLARFGAEAGFQAGIRFRAGGARQVMLTGEGIETPEMTTGGTEGQVLTYHADDVPTWEDGGGAPGSLALDDLTDVDAPSPADGEALVWDDGSSSWVPGAVAVADDDASLLIDLSISGATTVDRADAATHDLTLTGDATITPDHSDPTAGEAIDLRILIRQDGTGSHTLAWGGTITWASGSEPTMPTDAGALLTVGLLSVDDATTWLGYVAAEDVGPTAATTVEAETSWGITPAVGMSTDYAREDHTHGTPDEPTGTGGAFAPILIADDHSTPLVFGDLLQTDEGDDLLYFDGG